MKRSDLSLVARLMFSVVIVFGALLRTTTTTTTTTFVVEEPVLDGDEAAHSPDLMMRQHQARWKRQGGRSGAAGFGAGDVTNACGKKPAKGGGGGGADEPEEEGGPRKWRVPMLFYAPPVGGKYPPHVIRRMMRMCTKDPSEEKCKGHPEWVSRLPLPDEAPQNDDAAGGGAPLYAPVQYVRQARRRKVIMPAAVKRLIPPTLGKLGPSSVATISAQCGGGKCMQQT